jgi:hypothetical protein
MGVESRRVADALNGRGVLTPQGSGICIHTSVARVLARCAGPSDDSQTLVLNFS